MDKATDKEHEEYEATVVEDMAKASTIADKLFGLHKNVFAVHEIFDYLQEADEEEFATDLKRVIEHAKVAYKTSAPTPEQVFGLFERIFQVEED